MRLRFAFAAGLLALSAPLHAQADALLPEWMAGTWSMEDGSAWAEELWTAPRGAMMLGLSRNGFGPNVDGWESLRIVRKPNGIMAYIAQPKGGPPTEFVVTVMSDQSIEFANSAHDYPQRIRYWRQGQLLMAEVSKIDGSRPMRWNYRPVAGPPPDGAPPAN